MEDTTFITALYDLGRKSDQYDLNKYIDLLNKLLSLPLKFIIYTTSEIKLKLNPKDGVQFILDQPIPYTEKLTEISRVWGQKYRTNNPDKDTALFGCLTHAKFYWLYDSINNYCQTKNVAWIDAGIFKIALEPELLPTLKPTDKIKLMALNYTNKIEIKIPTFVHECRYKVAGGFFIGPVELMRRFCQHMMSFNIEGLEQEYMAVVLSTNRDLFDVYYGDFCDLFRNYNKVIYNKYLLERAIQTAHLYQDYQEVQTLKQLL